jgi:hypothetical protein
MKGSQGWRHFFMEQPAGPANKTSTAARCACCLMGEEVVRGFEAP